MSDLISRSALIEALEKLRASNPHVDARSRSQHNSEITTCIHRVNIAPTVEARPVVRGKWIYSKEYSSIYHKEYSICSCSVCDEIPDCFEPKFCPNCGADMRGGKNG